VWDRSRTYRHVTDRPPLASVDDMQAAMLKSPVASLDHLGGRSAQKDVDGVPVAPVEPPLAQLRQAAGRIAVPVGQQRAIHLLYPARLVIEVARYVDEDHRAITDQQRALAPVLADGSM
jgi:hypothetical protein